MAPIGAKIYHDKEFLVRVRLVYSMLRSDKRLQYGPPVTVFGFLLISLLYNGEICPCLPFFDLNQIGHNSVNFEATASRFCMKEDLEKEDEVKEVDDNDDDNDDATSKNVFFCI